MTILSARVVDAKLSATIRRREKPSDAFAAGVLIDRSGWNGCTGFRVRLSLPGEYREAAAQEGIYCFPAELGPDPLALVVCERAKLNVARGNVARSFEPVPSRYSAAAVKALAFTGGSDGAWLNFCQRSEDTSGFFSVHDFVQVRP